ncbi:hypothetical protein ABFA07_014356 [Porites harrisoni]
MWWLLKEPFVKFNVFSQKSLLSSAFIINFAVCVNFFFHLLILSVNFRTVVDGIVFHSFKCIGDTTSLEGSPHHLFRNIAPSLLYPGKDQVSGKSFPLASWSELEGA